MSDSNKKSYAAPEIVEIAIPMTNEGKVMKPVENNKGADQGGIS